jgi:hypothetical protein
MERQVRVVILCVDENGREKLVELRERHREVFDRYDSMVGLRIRVKRSGTARNSPVDLKVVKEEHAVERDISRLVESFGLPSISVGLEATCDEQPDTQSRSLESGL